MNQYRTQAAVPAMVPNTRLLLLWCEAALATTVVTIVIYLWWWTTEARRVRKFVRCDGSQTLPTPVPVLPHWLGFLGGHTLRMDIKKMFTQMENWADEFGGDYMLQAFGRRMVVLTSFADIRRVLALRPSKFCRGIDSEHIRWAAKEAGLAPSMAFDEGKQWGRSRRLISPNLAGHNITDMIPCISKIGERLCAKLGKHADADRFVDTKQYFARFTHDIIALVAFGMDVNSTDATDEHPCPSFRAVESTLSTLNALLLDVVKMLQWKYFSKLVPWIRRFKENSRQLDDLVQGAIDVARSSKAGYLPMAGPEEAYPGNLLRKIISKPGAKAKSDRMKLSDDEVQHEFNSLLIAGTDTTAVALSWAMYYLAKNPKALARCRTEGLTVAPSSRGMVSTSEQLSQLVFCAAVFREVVRLRSAVAAVSHICLETHTMENGYKIREGDAVVTLLRYASISEDCFTKGAEFVPERWIESERSQALMGNQYGKIEEGSIYHMDDAFLGFGSGPRVCPGKDMARAEAIIIIAAICSRFDISLASGQPDPPEEILQSTIGPEMMNLVFKWKEERVTSDIEDSKGQGRAITTVESHPCS